MNRSNPYYYKRYENGFHVVRSSNKVSEAVFSTVEEARVLCKALNLAVRRARMKK